MKNFFLFLLLLPFLGACAHSEGRSENLENAQTFPISGVKAQAEKAGSSRENDRSPTIKSAEDLDVAESTWGEYLNPEGRLPKEGFQAFYIDTENSRRVVATEWVEDVAISYVWDEFHNISSRNFGAYWVGSLALDREEVMRIGVSLSWAKVRILINGRVLYEGGGDQSVLYRFEPGAHKIEVEYINNWHTTEFSVDINSEVAYLGLDEIKAKLEDNVLGDYQVYYAGVYESASRNMETLVSLEKTSRPVLLVLSSYSPVKWRLSNPYGTDVRAIIYGSHKPGSTLTGDISGSVLRFPARSRIGSYDATPECRCVAGNYRCEGAGMKSTIAALQALTDKPLTGFSGQYSAASLEVPEIRVDDRYLEELEAKMDASESDRAECKSKSNPDFETMFEEKG